MGTKKIIAISLLSVIVIAVLAWYYKQNKITPVTNEPQAGTTAETNKDITLNEVEQTLFMFTKVEQEKIVQSAEAVKAIDTGIKNMSWLDVQLQALGF
jgi:hypothetical protein